MARKVPVLDVGLGDFGRRLGGGAVISRKSDTLIARAAREEIQRVMHQVVEDIRREFFKTGNAYNVMRYEGIRVTGTSLSNLRATLLGPEYIRRLEEGGTIRPTRASFLAIPIFHGVNSDGTPRLPNPRAWRNIVKTFVYTSKDGRKFLAYKQGSDLRIIYVLVDEVEVEGRGLIAKAFFRRAGSIQAVMLQAFRDEMDSKENHLLPKARITTGRRR